MIEASQIWLNGKFVSIGEYLHNAAGEVPHPHALGNVPISVSGNKSTDSGFSPLPNEAGVYPPACLGLHDQIVPADQVRSRLIKTNYGDDVKSCEFAISRFKEYLKKREDWYIKIHGKVNLTQTDFTYNKFDVHRWKDGYLKKRLARLYKLRDWFEKQPSQEVTMITLTVPHNENIRGEKVNTGHNPFQAWRNIKQGWTRLYQCKPGLFRDKEFVIFYEPHKSGYVHAHQMVFGTFTDEEIATIKRLWHEMTGADLLNGVEVRPGIGVKHLIAYLMKYTSKTYYHTIDSWTPGEWLFNAIAHEERYRLFGSSNYLAEVMRLETDSSGSVECLDVSLGGLKPRSDDDVMRVSRCWTNPNHKQNHPMLRQYTPIPTSDYVDTWKKKNNIVDSPAETIFKKRFAVWKKRGGDQWRDLKIAGLVAEYNREMAII